MASPSWDRPFPTRGAAVSSGAIRFTSARRPPTGSVRCGSTSPASGSGWDSPGCPRSGALARGDVGDQGIGRLPQFFPGLRLTSSPRLDVVVRSCALDQRGWFVARVASRARAAQVPVRAAADPLLARAVGALRRHRRGSGFTLGPSRCSPSPSASQPRRPSLPSTRSHSDTCPRHCSGAPSPGSRHSFSSSGCCVHCWLWVSGSPCRRATS